MTDWKTKCRTGKQDGGLGNKITDMKHYGGLENKMADWKTR
jgi:hypothetical protein